jgi:phage-related protein
MALNPFSLIAAGVALLVIALVAAYNKFEWFRDGIKTIVNTVIGFFAGMVNAAIGAVNAIISAYNSIPLLPNIPEAPRLSIPQLGGSTSPQPGRNSIPRMADGGIVTSPTLALIGEAGPEAVVPLSRMGQMSGPTNITVNVQGADPQQVVNALERYVRQNGSLPGALL